MQFDSLVVILFRMFCILSLACFSSKSFGCKRVDVIIILYLFVYFIINIIFFLLIFLFVCIFYFIILFFNFFWLFSVLWCLISWKRKTDESKSKHSKSWQIIWNTISFADIINYCIATVFTVILFFCLISSYSQRSINRVTWTVFVSRSF